MLHSAAKVRFWTAVQTWTLLNQTISSVQSSGKSLNRTYDPVQGSGIACFCWTDLNPSTTTSHTNGLISHTGHDQLWLDNQCPTSTPSSLVFEGGSVKTSSLHVFGGNTRRGNPSLVFEGDSAKTSSPHFQHQHELFSKVTARRPLSTFSAPTRGGASHLFSTPTAPLLLLPLSHFWRHQHKEG